MSSPWILSHKNAYNLLAYSYDNIDNLEKSIWAIDKYIEIAPDEPNPYDTRGDLYARNGQVELAIASYRKALAIKPDFISGSKLAALFVQIGRISMRPTVSFAHNWFTRTSSIDRTHG